LNENFNVKDALKAKSDELKTALGLQLGHPVSQGDLGEGEWLRFLNSFLPKRYAAMNRLPFLGHKKWEAVQCQRVFLVTHQYQAHNLSRSFNAQENLTGKTHHEAFSRS
jgi:hypothetical protein